MPSRTSSTVEPARWSFALSRFALGQMGRGLLTVGLPMLLTISFSFAAFVWAAQEVQLRSWEPWLVLTAGLSFSLLLGTLLLAVSIQQARTEQMIEAQTAELVRSSARFQAVLDASTQTSIIATDLQGIITVFNAGAERMLGYTAEEMVGRRTPESFHLLEEVVARGQALTRGLGHTVAGFEVFVHMARREAYEEREWTYITKDGRHLQVNLSVTAKRDESGKIVGFLGVASDISERKQVESAMREAGDRLRLALENAQHGMWDWDLATNRLVLEENWYAILGYQVVELFTTLPTWKETLHPDDQEQVLAALQAHLESPESRFDIDYRARHRNGEWIWINSRGRVCQRDAAGKPLRMMGTIQDISERKAAETILAYRAEELARSNAELEQFAYVASHDLREPLRMVQSFCGLLKDRYSSQLDERANKYIHFAVDGAGRMQRLVDDLLQFSRVGRCNERFRSVPLEAIVQQAWANVAVAASDADAQIEIGPLPSVQGDAARLEQLCQNLIANAIKFRSGAPPVIRISAQHDAEGWRFTVADNGIGIDPKHFSRLFTVFQRLHTKDEYPGTGIGLALCKRIVDFHGGRIWLESQPGHGTSVHFRLLSAEKPSINSTQLGAECVLRAIAI
jgi:PAS domain S-box-containing protein